jgi:hypothetical protein
MHAISRSAPTGRPAHVAPGTRARGDVSAEPIRAVTPAAHAALPPNGPFAPGATPVPEAEVGGPPTPAAPRGGAA